MNEMVYRYSPAQRRAVLGSALACGTWAVAGTVYCGVVVAGHRIVDVVGEWAVLGLVPGAVGALAAALARGTTRVDDEGIDARSAGRRWRCSWAVVRSVETMTELGRGNGITRIRITRTDGPSFKIPAPYDSQSMGRDPDFDLKLAQIRRRWAAGRKAGPRSA